MRHRIVIALNSLKIFNKIFLMKKKSFFVEFDVSNHLKINIIFYKMNTLNAHYILRDAIISIVFAIVFFRHWIYCAWSTSSQCSIQWFLMNFNDFMMNLLRMLIVIAIFNLWIVIVFFFECFWNRRSFCRRDFFCMWY